MNGEVGAPAEVDPAPRSSARLFDVRLLGRHQLAAAFATLVDFATMVALVEVARVLPPTATLVSATVGGVANFTVGRLWAFRARHQGSMTSQGARYALVCAGGAFVNASLLGALLAVASWPYVVARIVVSVLVSLVYTYPLHTRFVFRAMREADDGDESL